jgi:hypothetical protein
VASIERKALAAFLVFIPPVQHYSTSIFTPDWGHDERTKEMKQKIKQSLTLIGKSFVWECRVIRLTNLFGDIY